MEVLLDTRGQRKLKSLLLIYLFVKNIAAECPAPQAVENMVPTQESLLLNAYPEGSEVKLECSSGFIKESGSGITKCVNDQWTEPDITCKKKDCGIPPVGPNMYFDMSEGTLYGASVKVLCDKGFEITSGSSYKYCYASGWFGEAECGHSTCDKPEEVENGSNSWKTNDDPIYGEVITYSCNEGFIISGNVNITCSEDGKYDFQAPTCIGVSTETTNTTKMVTSASASTKSVFYKTTQIMDSLKSTSTVSSTPAAHSRDTTITASVSPPASTSTRVIHTETIDTYKDNVVALVTISILVILLVLLIVGVFVLKFLLRRKGSYDTREDRKPELLQFQNL